MSWEVKEDLCTKGTYIEFLLSYNVNYNSINKYKPEKSKRFIKVH